MKKEGFSVATTEGKGCKLHLSITVDKEEVKKAYKQAVKRINKEVSLPGFRKGKAPDDVIIQKYSPQIEREWKEIVVNDAFQAALEETRIYPYNRNTIDKPKIDKCSLEEGALVHLSYECYPKVPDIALSTLSLPPIEKGEVQQKEIDAIVHEVRQAHAGWEEIPSKSLEEGDYVDLSIDKIDEDPPHPLIQKRRFEISPVMVSWLKKILLSGLEVGSSAEGETYPDERATEEEKNSYLPIKVRVTLHAIQKILLPDLDDALAQKAGASTKEELLANIRSNLERDLEAKHKEKKIAALESLLLETYPFEVPSSLLASETHERIEQKTEELRKQHVSQEKIEEEREKIATWAKQHAEESLRLHYLMEEIATQGKVSLSREELNEKLNREILGNPYYHRIAKEDNAQLQQLLRRWTTHFQQEKIREYALTQVHG